MGRLHLASHAARRAAHIAPPCCKLGDEGAWRMASRVADYEAARWTLNSTGLQGEIYASAETDNEVASASVGTTTSSH
eukprot:7590213-Pyramimonas_sp.AAC.1